MSADAEATYQPGDAVQVLSKSSGAWVDAYVHQVLADRAVWVRYGNAQKVVPLELQPSTLRRKAAAPSLWALGQRVQVFSKSQQLWMSGVVREIWPNGSVHVQYEEAQLQESLLRRFTAVASTEAPQRSAEDQRLVNLAHESECLKATIARQQEQIDALLKQKELKDEKIEKQVQQVQVHQEAEPRQEARNADNWSCRDCTFQNIQQLQECEMCGAARSLERPVKRSRKAPAVIEVPQDASPVRDLSAGPREFLRQATQVVEANASQSALQENHELREADLSEATCKSKLGVEVFRAIGLLKRLCNHPLLAANSEAPEEPEVPEAEDAEPGKMVERMLKNFGHMMLSRSHSAGCQWNLKRDVTSLVNQSAKLQCLSSLLPALAADGHRTLIFSQGVRMMDLVEICVLKRLGITYLRIDGQTDVNARNERVQKFQSESQHYSCMLLTTRVGGYGLNLTSADRVIILDPAWNPAVDMQAVDRAHRIGQEREVKTYRLIMSGLIEEPLGEAMDGQR
eukprot:Skav210608  [mRNA]  locus=scaffold234:144025:160683:+ [translate_table: standard]